MLPPTGGTFERFSFRNDIIKSIINTDIDSTSLIDSAVNYLMIRTYATNKESAWKRQKANVNRSTYPEFEVKIKHISL